MPKKGWRTVNVREDTYSSLHHLSIEEESSIDDVIRKMIRKRITSQADFESTGQD